MPLNLTVYFRGLLRLRDGGYPSYWLSTGIVDIVSNNVATSARYTTTVPLAVAEAKQDHPVKRLTTASPYTAVMWTLAT